jgi:dTMP kinase
MGKPKYVRPESYVNSMPLIILEGPDGVGKTTVQMVMAELFEALEIPVLLTKEPGSQSSAACCMLRAVLAHNALTLDEQELIFSADRLIHQRTVVYPAITKGICVVSDRGPLSTWIHQPYTSERDFSVFTDVTRKYANNDNYDITVILIRGEEDLEAIRSAREDDVDAMAREAEARKVQVRKLYRSVAEASMYSHDRRRHLLGRYVNLTGTTTTTRIYITPEETPLTTALRVIKRVRALCLNAQVCQEFTEKCNLPV